MQISATFDGGNIEILACDDPADIRLAIRADGQADFRQWFHFRLTGAKDRDCTLHLTNAGGSSYPGGWDGYRAVASYDRRDWFRVDTSYADGVLTIRHRPAATQVYFAYFAPYSRERHADAVADWAMRPGVELSVLGATLDGQDLDYLRIGAVSADKPNLWVIARQHPGETMASWWMEGFMRRLLDPADPVARVLRAKATFHVVPNMNPDGSRRGHLRTNAAGADLNREWGIATVERSPEVFLVREAMRTTGIDFCLDVHGDEVLPYNFLVTAFGIPSLTELQRQLHLDYADALVRASPDFQTAKGYPAAQPGKANLALCSNYLTETFGCLAMTLEQPFKDTIDSPDDRAGWSPERADRLGMANLDAMLAVVDRLKQR